MEKTHFRFYIQVRTYLGEDATKIHKDLSEFAGDQCPSFSTVWRWRTEFSSGKKTIEDLPRLGRPIVETSPDNIKLVENFINDDPYCTYDEMEAGTLLCRGTLERIVHDHLKLRNLCSRWIPHLLTSDQKKNVFKFAKKI